MEIIRHHTLETVSGARIGLSQCLLVSLREAVEEDPDTYLLDDDWLETAQFVMPSSEKERITIRLDAEILDFFRSAGDGYQSRINKVLREYMAVQRYKQQTDSAADE